MGQKYGVFDVNGLPTAFYSEEIHSPEMIPVEAVAITEEQWREFINNANLRKWENGSVVPYDPPNLEQPSPEFVSRAESEDGTVWDLKPDNNGNISVEEIEQ